MSAATTDHPRRIAFVSDAIYPYNKGGKETRLYQISTRLAAKGYDVHIYTMQWWKGSKDKDEHRVHLHAICSLYHLYDGERRSIKEGLMFGLACFRLIGADFDIVDVDHMPFFPLYSMRIVCWLRGKKLSATWHEVWGKKYWKQYLPGFKGDIAAMIEQWSFHLPEQIISVSDMTSQRIREMGYKGDLVTVSNGIDADAIASVLPAKRASDVIFAGRLLKHKHIDLLIEAIALLVKDHPKIKCLIVGDGPELPNLQSLTSNLSLEKNVTFLPFQSDIAETYALMKSSKVFVLPSTREGFGLVVLEANACGLPVITIDHPDNAAKDLVTNGNGRTVPLSSNQIAISIESFLLRSPRKMSFSIPRVYDWDFITQSWIKGGQG